MRPVGQGIGVHRGQYVDRRRDVTGDGVGDRPRRSWSAPSLPEGGDLDPSGQRRARGERRQRHGPARLGGAAEYRRPARRPDTPIDAETSSARARWSPPRSRVLPARAGPRRSSSWARCGVRSARCSSAARRIGDGDFSQTVPVVGNDELAGLASEFNKMSDRLEAADRRAATSAEEIDRSLQRLGEAIAAGLDREALIEIVVETAVGACDARVGRVALSDGTVVTKGGRPATAVREAIRVPSVGRAAGLRRSERTRSARDCGAPWSGSAAAGAGRDLGRPGGRGVRPRTSATCCSTSPARPRPRSRTSRAGGGRRAGGDRRAHRARQPARFREWMEARRRAPGASATTLAA